LERRLLALTPTGKDAALARTILAKAAIECVTFLDLPHLLAELERGAGALLLAEELVSDDAGDQLIRVLARQPPWSDVPLLLLTRTGVDSPTVAQLQGRVSNITLLERPLRMASLVSAVRTAIAARERQYQIRAHLEERERTERLLSDADRRKDEFIAVLAHELRNPLAPIRHAIDVIRLSGDDPALVQSAHGIIERQVSHITRLVDDLLEISRINQGKIDLRMERVELASILASAVETSRPAIDAGQHQLFIDIPRETLVVHADPVRLAQVFTNLLNNAARYMDDGGRICLQARRDGDQVLVLVSDRGFGIPTDMLQRIFEMFSQVDRGAGVTRGGLGIGLSLVRKLVVMHGGDVEARSEGSGKGSEFLVRLPLVSGSSADELRSQDLPVGLGRSHRVLVADDNREAADSLGMLLRMLGAQVQVAYCGRDALALITGYEPDAVLLDLGMPDMDGYEVGRRIREDPRLRRVKLIAVTGWGRNGDRQRSRAIGFDHHLTKPVELGALRAVLGSLA
jgi:signal transduction histidine kinase